MQDHVDGPAGARHVPVLLPRVTALLAPVLTGRDAVLVDATLGLGGHAAALLAAHPRLTLVGLDRDPDALALAGRRLVAYADRTHLVHAIYDRIGEIVAGLGLGPVDGVLFDLGVSSLQLDADERGFSYSRDADLDMRMDPTSGTTADDIVNHADEAEIMRILRRFGDERHAPRIAKAIVASRPIRDTSQLAEVVREAIPAAARRTGGHPATRAFQAFRIEVNDELGQLERALGDALDLLVPGGRAAVITYHSGEDKIVARRFRDAAADDCVCPPGVGSCRCDGAPSVTLVPRKAITASDDEIDRNPRARSARLRVAEQLGEAV